MSPVKNAKFTLPEIKTTKRPSVDIMSPKRRNIGVDIRHPDLVRANTVLGNECDEINKLELKEPKFGRLISVPVTETTAADSNN